MARIPAGPRKYRIFICHRYKDNDLYDRLRRSLRKAPNFRYQNLSVQDDMLLSLRTEAGLKRSITAKVKRADVMLVFAHSAGKWIAHELAAARRYSVPVISILDPKRVADRTKRARTEQVTSHRCSEVSLTEDKEIVEAIRENARPQRPAVPIEQMHVPHVLGVVQAMMPEEPLSTPADIARRINSRHERKGFIARLGMLFRRRPPEHQDRAL